jgi:sterol desaturase/sphingolipid hydroxylase (fatty acid hydroxylase superfamily)
MVADQPGWVQFLEILVLADFLAYLYHRAIHKYAWLWRLHTIHHSSQRMDWLANVRLHPVDKILGDCFQFIPIFCLGFSGTPVLAYTIFLGFQGFFNHSNIKVDFGPLRWIIASPEFHHWHHCDDAKAHNKNFAPHLVIFDRLFGTAYFPPDRAMPANYGIPEPVPKEFWRQMIAPFGHSELIRRVSRRQIPLR